MKNSIVFRVAPALTSLTHTQTHTNTLKEKPFVMSNSHHGGGHGGWRMGEVGAGRPGAVLPPWVRHGGQRVSSLLPTTLTGLSGSYVAKHGTNSVTRSSSSPFSHPVLLKTALFRLHVLPARR